jgi:Leucine-rich repeat (LRR) protein
MDEFPAEMVFYVADQFSTPRDQMRFFLTCRRFYHLAALFHWKIPYRYENTNVSPGQVRALIANSHVPPQFTRLVQLKLVTEHFPKLANLPRLRKLEITVSSFPTSAWDGIPSGLKQLTVNQRGWYRQLGNLPPCLPNLRKLSINGFYLAELPYYPKLAAISITRSIIGPIPVQYSPQLIYFSARNSTLPKIQPYSRLRTLDLALSDYPAIIPNIESLTALNCAATTISCLPYFPKLRELDCSNSWVKHLSPQLTNLEKLICQNTHISNIPAEYKRLTHLDCRRSAVQIIPDSLRAQLTVLLWQHDP